MHTKIRQYILYVSNNSLKFTNDQPEIGGINMKEIDSIVFEEPSIITTIPKNAFFQANFRDDDYIISLDGVSNNRVH